jgi:hypothetical protein
MSQSAAVANVTFGSYYINLYRPLLLDKLLQKSLHPVQQTSFNIVIDVI